MKAERAEKRPGKRVGIWIRVSTEDQARGESPEHHEHRARQYAGAKGWSVVDVYHLEAVSGKSVMGHAETVRMLEDIERGHISGLIFSKLARLGRNTRELLEFSDIFQKREADLISLEESIDTSTPAGRLFYTMIAAMAHWEREEIASRVAASIEVRAKLGKPLGGSAPYGYRWENRKLVVHPEEAPVRKLAYALFAEHKRKATVARLLNEMGYRARRGRPFQHQTIEYLITDPTAKGVRRGNYSKRVDGPKGWAYKPESEWVFTECEAIVSEDLWDRCNVILAEQKAKGKRSPRKPVQLFGGLTWCGVCGHKMYVKSNTPKYVCRNCHNKIAVIDLEDIFVEQLRAFLVSPEEINRHLQQANEDLGEKIKLLAMLEREHVKVKKKIEEGFELYHEGALTAKEFGQRHGPYSQRNEQLEEEIPRLREEIESLKVGLATSDEVLHEARDLYAHWPNLTHENKRKVIDAVTERITIGKEEIQIELLHLTPGEEIAVGVGDNPAEPSENGPEGPIGEGPDKHPTPSRSIPKHSLDNMGKSASHQPSSSATRSA